MGYPSAAYRRLVQRASHPGGLDRATRRRTMSGKVRAKFYVQEIKHVHSPSPDTVCAVVKLAAVYGDGKGNETWSKYTPQGSLEMTITNPAAIEAFELGKSYFLDITPAD
jgi:hypothetical protein